MGIGIGVGTLVTLSLGVFLFFMERKAKKRQYLQQDPKETPRQYYQFDDMNKPNLPESNTEMTPQTSSDTIPALVIEE